MNTNDFIKELRKVSASFSEYDDEADSVNGFILDGNGVGKYSHHLDVLYMEYFDQINDHVDNLSLNNNIPMILNFLDSKIKRIDEINAPVKESDEFLDGIVNRLEESLTNAIKYNYVACDNCNGPDNCPACQETRAKQAKTIRLRRLNQDFLSFKIDVPTYSSTLEKEGEFDSRYYSNLMDRIGREYIQKSFDRLHELYKQYSHNEKDSKKTVTSIAQVERDFKSYLHHDNKDALIEKLHELLDGEKSKTVAVIIKILMDMGILPSFEINRVAIYDAIRDEFDFIGSDSGLNQYFRIEGSFYITRYKSEIDKYRKIIEAI